MYDLKYKSEFYNAFLTKVTVDIYKKDYGTHAVILLRATGVQLEVNYQDENTPIVGTGVKLNIVNEGTLDSLKDLLTSREKQFLCIIKYNDTSVFAGWSICDLNEQQLLPNAVITLQFTDYFRRLDSVRISSLANAGGSSCLMTILQDAMVVVMTGSEQLGDSGVLNVHSSLFETTMSQSADETFIEQVYLKNNVFYSDANTYNNAYDALNKALKSFNAHLFSYGEGSWFIERIDDITRLSGFVEFTDMLGSSMAIGASTALSFPVLNKQAGDFKYLELSQIVEYDSGLKTLILRLKDKQLETAIFNDYSITMLSTADNFPTAGSLDLYTWYKYTSNTIFRTGYAYRGIGSYVYWKCTGSPYEYNGLYYAFKITFNQAENYVDNPEIVEEVPTVLDISFKQTGKTDLTPMQTVATRFTIMINEGTYAGWYLRKLPLPNGEWIWDLIDTPFDDNMDLQIRNDFDVSTSGNKDRVWNINENINLTDRALVVDDIGTHENPSIWEQLGKPATISFIVGFFPSIVFTKGSPSIRIVETDNIIGDIQVGLASQRIANKLTYYINDDFIKTEEIDMDFFDLDNDNFSNGLEMLRDSAGAQKVKTKLWKTYQHPTPYPLMDQFTRVKFGNYCHTLHKLKGTILCDRYLKPFSVLTDDNLKDDSGNNIKFILHGYVWDLNNGTYEIEAVEYTEEVVSPDNSYDSAAAPFFLHAAPTSLAWEYNDATYQEIAVTTNMARWYIHDGSYHYGFGLTVYNGASLVTDGIYTDGMTIRVTPNSTNMTIEAKTLVVYLANESNEIMASFTGVQAFSGLNIPPVITGIVSDASFTLISFSGSGITNSNYITVSWTPILCLLSDFTMYMTVVRGGLTVGNAMYPHNFNSTTRSMDIYISEILVAGATYQVQFRTS